MGSEMCIRDSLRYKRVGIKKDKLRDVFTSIMRSVLEFSSVVYHSLLSKFQSNLLDKVQKKTLRMIYGYEKSYKELLELLEESGLQSLADRRVEAVSKFAHKTIKNPKYSARWFPQRQATERSLRSAGALLEEFANGNRLY